jgi:hypothetical protein
VSSASFKYAVFSDRERNQNPYSIHTRPICDFGFVFFAFPVALDGCWTPVLDDDDDDDDDAL